MRSKTTLALVHALLCCQLGFSQLSSVERTVLKTNLFSEFRKGEVLLKDGKVEPAFLNYDTETQAVVFKQNDEIMVFADPATVDTVYISQRKFILIDKSFYEVVAGDPITLFISYTNKKKPLVASPDQNGVARKTADQSNNNVAQAYVSRPNQLNFEATVINHNWLRRGKSLYKANNQDQWLKVFPFRNNELIKNYIKENKIDFTERTDVRNLVVYCNQQLQKS